MAGDGALARAAGSVGALSEPPGQMLRDPDPELPLSPPDVGASTPTFEFVYHVGASRGGHAVFGRPDPDCLAAEDDAWLGCRVRGFGGADDLVTEMVGRTVTKEGERDDNLLARRASCYGLGVVLSDGRMLLDEG